MGLKGYYLALDYQSVSNDFYFNFNNYDISENNYSDLEINGSKYNKSAIKEPFYFYDSSADVVALYYKKYSNIKVPSDISLENGDTFIYTDIETNNNFTIKLEDNEKSGGNIIRKLNYNVLKKTPDNSSSYVNIHNVICDSSFDCKLNDNSFNYTYFSEFIHQNDMYSLESYYDNYGDVYDNSNIKIEGAYIDYYCHGLIFKNAYYRIKSINFTENNDLSLNNVYFNLQNKLLKKKVMIEVWVDIYENIDIIKEIDENRYIGTCNFRKEINKEENITNLWEYCYDNLKILLKKYIDNCINNFKLFEYSDVSSNIIDM
tara:strand:- start:395 stop:1345 length:951 start_codon:yes stop_codon:yes gene_type:complete